MSILFTIQTRRTKTPLRLSSSILAFASLIVSPLSSTAKASPPSHDNVISRFLLDECHLSSSQIAKVMKTDKSLLRRRSSQSAREVVEFMRDCGFTETQLHNTILSRPTFLRRKVDGHLKPLFDLLTTLGFVGQKLPILVTKQPRLLGCSLEKNLSARIPFLQEICGSKRNLFNALKYAPELLILSVEKQLKPKLDFLKQRGIEGKSLSVLLSRHPSSFSRVSLELLQMREEYVVNTLGITKDSKRFVDAICVLLQNRPETVEKKMKHLQSLGLLEDEIHELVKKVPWLLAYSTKKMQENMEFLTYTAGLQPNVVLSLPSLLRFSVDKRLRPRHAVVRALHAMQRSVPSLPRIFNFSEKIFLQKFVECDPQASMLKEIYKGEVNSTVVKTT